MNKRMTFGVQFARAVNIITIVFDIIVVVFLSVITVSAFIGRYSASGANPNYFLLGILLMLLLALFLAPAVLMYLLNRELLRLNPMARVWQIILSCVLLFLFPIGTLLNGIILYFMLFDKSTKEVFEGSEAAKEKGPQSS